MSQEEFLLKWNDHHASFFTIVEDLCRTEQLCDVTLACGGQVFETHKLILSVCSPYFRTLLNSRPDKHPIVYLKDVNPKHLEQLLSYMYRGEINVLQDDLGPLIETARGLQIKVSETCVTLALSALARLALAGARPWPEECGHWTVVKVCQRSVTSGFHHHPRPSWPLFSFEETTSYRFSPFAGFSRCGWRWGQQQQRRRRRKWPQGDQVESERPL